MEEKPAAIEELRQAFYAYIELVTVDLRCRSENRGASGPPTALLNTVTDLYAFVERWEKHLGFKGLARATGALFPSDFVVVNFWEPELQHFFRRSRFYKDAYEGRDIDVAGLFQNLLGELRRRTTRVTYIAPIEGIDFSETSIEFVGFRIRRFSAAELAEIFHNDVSEVFYPWAFVDVGRLSNFWCIEVEEDIDYPVNPLDQVIDLDLSPSLRKEFSAFPKALEEVLQQFVLYDWQVAWSDVPEAQEEERDQEPGPGWFRFDIPCVLEVSDNLFIPPRRTLYIPEVDVNYTVMSEADDGLVEVPFYAFEMSDDDLASFKAFVADIQGILTRLEPHLKKWAFVEIGLGFLIKAFFTDGLQQLLWHITVLESFLGENKESLTELLSNRLVIILDVGEDRDAFREKFKTLYDFRSRLVHGDDEILKKKVYVGHLREARIFARETALWFLRFLDHVQANYQNAPRNMGLPERKDILTVLDMKPGRRAKVGWLLGTLPEDFPSPRRSRARQTPAS
jgi:hypothetical protein